MQESSQVSYCKNHQTIPSGYFLTEQPWIKYCRTCALNVALCGRKIEKQLTSQQFDRKMKISTTVSQMKNGLDQIQMTNDYYQQLTQILEQAAEPLKMHIKMVDNVIKELATTRDKLQNIYIQQISEKIHLFFEKQSKITFLSLQVKKQIQTIQSNYGNLIQMPLETEFCKEKEKWTQVFRHYKNQILFEEQFKQNKQKIAKSVEQCYNQLESISQWTFDLKLDRKLKKYQTNKDDFDVTLTPIQENSLCSSVNLQTLKLNLRRGPLKLKTNTKTKTQRDSINNSKLNTRRKSFYGLENIEVNTKRMVN